MFSTQVEKKTELIQKMEAENTSLSQQLNDKSLTLERFQSEVLKMSTELDKKKKEVHFFSFTGKGVSFKCFYCAEVLFCVINF